MLVLQILLWSRRSGRRSPPIMSSGCNSGRIRERPKCDNSKSSLMPNVCNGRFNEDYNWSSRAGTNKIVSSYSYSWHERPDRSFASLLDAHLFTSLLFLKFHPHKRGDDCLVLRLIDHTTEREISERSRDRACQ